MRTKSYLVVGLTVIISIISFLAYVYFTKTPQFTQFYSWSQSNLVLFITVVFVLKTIGIIYPPMSGGIFTLGAIPILGLIPAYLVDLGGSILAGTIDYYLGKKYGLAVLNKLFDTSVIQKIKSLKVKPHREIESVFVMRILLGGVIVEAVYYGAGLIGVRFVNFLIGATLSHILVGIPTFLVGEAIFKSQNMIMATIIVATALFIAYKLKGRYFE